MNSSSDHKMHTPYIKNKILQCFTQMYTRAYGIMLSSCKSYNITLPLAEKKLQKLLLLYSAPCQILVILLPIYTARHANIYLHFRLRIIFANGGIPLIVYYIYHSYSFTLKIYYHCSVWLHIESTFKVRSMSQLKM